ncbi:MAG TPA: GTPase Era [Candidatus Polarisedimenticolia bacterium]|jgi:GTP-binding protein Era
MSETPAETRSGFAAVVGRPNVGKSTLINLLVGEKVAIVSDVAQTTRNRIHGFVNLPGGQMVLVDTPGIHKPLHGMNRLMVDEASDTMRGVDLILFMIEAVRPTSGLGPGDRFVLSELPRDGPPVLLVINKVDRVRKEDLLPLIDRVKDTFPFKEILLVSALKAQNTRDLAGKLLAYMPEGPPLFPLDQFTDQQERFLASELIREKILHHTRQEIPHETCVLIEVWDESRSDLTRIEATILVEKESQKKIVIGREGSMLKTVGTEAREDLERMLDRKVFLKLWVRARGGWRDDDAILERLGIRRAG